MAKLASLAYDLSWYTPYNILISGRRDQSAVRKEYSRLRDVAQKRLKRLEKKAPKSKAYKKYKNSFKKLKDIETPEELASRLSTLARFVQNKETTLKGYKEAKLKKIATLKEHDFDFVTEDNLEEFGDFMEEFRNLLLDMEYDSSDAAELFGIVQKKKLKPEKVKKNFEKYLDKYVVYT